MIQISFGYSKQATTCTWLSHSYPCTKQMRGKRHRKKNVRGETKGKNNSEFLLCRRSMRTHFSIYEVQNLWITKTVNGLIMQPGNFNQIHKQNRKKCQLNRNNRSFESYEVPNVKAKQSSQKKIEHTSERSKWKKTHTHRVKLRPRDKWTWILCGNLRTTHNWKCRYGRLCRFSLNTEVIMKNWWYKILHIKCNVTMRMRGALGNIANYWNE